MTPPAPKPKHGIQRNPPTHIVFAGNFKEFRQWQLTSGVKNGDALFVADASNLQGFMGGEGLTLVRYGTFHLRPDVASIMNEVRARFPDARWEDNTTV